MPINRRDFLCTVAAAAGSRSLSAERTPYTHRGYLGWITDLDSRPDSNAAWPSMRLDESLIEDYRQTLALMRRLGYNELVVWGLYVSRDWPTELGTAVAWERGKLVERLIDMTHRQGLRLIAGLGVFSWGFEGLIRKYPSLGRTNPRAMCASNPEAWGWMEKITDFVFTRFPIDGVSMQSADQGRCNCSACSRYSDAEYHARINLRLADYIRGKWPGKTVAASGWGMKFEEQASLLFVTQMSAKLDYLIDVSDSARQHSRPYRRKIIQSASCAFGTLGGAQVEPPQHWNRDRWFMPTAKAQGEHLRDLADDGGRACEYFYHILANPGDEVSFHVAGRTMMDIRTPWREHLRTTIEELYRVTKASTVDALAGLFLQAEDAYLTRIPTMFSGTISMEPLVGDHAGPPVYLSERMKSEQRRSYALDLEKVAAGFRQIAPDVPEKTKIARILRCIENVKADLKSLSG